MPGKRGRPRKHPDGVVTQEQDLTKINTALDKLALARDYAAAIENGGLGPQDFAELASEARKAICDAGERLEKHLCGLGLVPEGSGWFVLDLKRVKGNS